MDIIITSSSAFSLSVYLFGIFFPLYFSIMNTRLLTSYL